MGETIQLISGKDGFAYDAWHEPPREARRGGLVIFHAIWGVTPHLRELAGEYAEQGYEVVIPSLFDRYQRGFAEQNTDPTLYARQEDFAIRSGWGLETLDAVQAAIDSLKGPVFAMGFCFGGTVAWLAAARCSGLSSVAAFYGGQIKDYLDETPSAPIILHFGKHDELIPPADVEAFRARHPDLAAYLYDAGHGFVAPSGFHEDSARLAKLRTAAFFARNGGGRGES